MKRKLSRFYNFKYKHRLIHISNQNTQVHRRSLSKLFYMPRWNNLSNITTYRRKMNLKYIVNNLGIKNVLANYIMIDMSTDDKLSSYSEDIVKINDKY